MFLDNKDKWVGREFDCCNKQKNKNISLFATRCSIKLRSNVCRWLDKNGGGRRVDRIGENTQELVFNATLQLNLPDKLTKTGVLIWID